MQNRLILSVILRALIVNIFLIFMLVISYFLYADRISGEVMEILPELPDTLMGFKKYNIAYCTDAHCNNRIFYREKPVSVCPLCGNKVEHLSSSERFMFREDVEFRRAVYISDIRDERYTVMALRAISRPDVLHRPEMCFEGQGGSITSRRSIHFKLKNGEEMETIMLVIGNRAIVCYWYEYKDIRTVSHWYRTFLSFYHALFKRENMAWTSYIIVGESGARVEEFYPAFSEFVANFIESLMIEKTK